MSMEINGRYSQYQTDYAECLKARSEEHTSELQSPA